MNVYMKSGPYIDVNWTSEGRTMPTGLHPHTFKLFSEKVIVMHSEKMKVNYMKGRVKEFSS